MFFTLYLPSFHMSGTDLWICHPTPSMAIAFMIGIMLNDAYECITMECYIFGRRKNLGIATHVFLVALSYGIIPLFVPIGAPGYPVQ
jgi:hypothetical protein